MINITNPQTFPKIGFKEMQEESGLLSFFLSKRPIRSDIKSFYRLKRSVRTQTLFNEKKQYTVDNIF